MRRKWKAVTITKVEYHTLFARVILSDGRKISVWAYKGGWYCNLSFVDLQQCLAAYSVEELWERGDKIGERHRCIKITGDPPWEGLSKSPTCQTDFVSSPQLSEGNYDRFS